MESLDEPTMLASLAHPDPDVRLWTVRLLCDEKTVSKTVAAALVEMAVKERTSTCSANLPPPPAAPGRRRVPCCET